MSKHPTIPPNVKMVRKPSALCPGQFHWTIEGCSYIYFEDNHTERMIVSAVAESAWRKEFYRLRAMIVTPENWQFLIKESDKNSDAWVKWGEQQ